MQLADVKYNIFVVIDVCFLLIYTKLQLFKAAFCMRFSIFIILISLISKEEHFYFVSSQAINNNKELTSQAIKFNFQFPKYIII